MPDDTQNHIPGETLHRLVHAYRRAMRDALDAAGMPLPISHLRMLKWIAKTPDITAQQIAAHTAQDKGRITRLVKELEDKNLIERHPHPQDRRSQTLHLTENGHAIMNSIKQVETGVRSRMARGMTPQQIRDFNAIAALMAANLET